MLFDMNILYCIVIFIPLIPLLTSIQTTLLYYVIPIFITVIVIMHHCSVHLNIGGRWQEQYPLKSLPGMPCNDDHTINNCLILSLSKPHLCRFNLNVCMNVCMHICKWTIDKGGLQDNKTQGNYHAQVVEDNNKEICNFSKSMISM